MKALHDEEEPRQGEITAPQAHGKDVITICYSSFLLCVHVLGRTDAI